MGKTSNQLRIIGGQWRGRKIEFPAIVGLRPTPNRIRETLFNWLTPTINGAICLDLFAGSGALGFEALSRGAEKVVFVDKSAIVYQYVTDTLKLLACEDGEVYCQNAEQFLDKCHQQFDIIFLDPPFYTATLEKTCALIAAKQLIKPSGYIYVETERQSLLLPDNWQILRHKTAGKVNYYLVVQGNF